MDLSIIIVSYRTKDLLDKCLESILKTIQEIEFEIIVIDNNSQDGSTQMLREKYPQATLIRNNQNLGFAKACNQGIRRSCGKYLFFLNPDTFILENIFSNIFQFFENNPQVGVGGCFVYYPDGKPQTSFYKFTTLQNTIGEMLSLFRFLPRNKLTEDFFWTYPLDRIPSEVDRVLGGAMIVRRTLFEEIGVFNESYFLYNEDEDLCYRARMAGWKIVPLFNTKVLHHYGQSMSKDLKNTTFHSFCSAFVYFSKFHPIYKIILFRITQFWGAFLRIIFWFFTYLLCPKTRYVARGKLAGYIKILLSNSNYSKSLT